jgi:hypothetical protein
MKSLATNEKCCRTRRSGRLDEGLVQLRLAFDIAADSVQPDGQTTIGCVLCAVSRAFCFPTSTSCFARSWINKTQCNFVNNAQIAVIFVPFNLDSRVT